MASTEEEIIAAPVDHSTPKQSHPKIFGREHEDWPERKSLQTLQQSAGDETALVGIGVTHTKPGKSTEPVKFRPSHGQVKLYHDASTVDHASAGQAAAATESRATQTDDSLLEDLIQQHLAEREKRDHSLVEEEEEEEEEEAYQLMVKEPVPETYWKEVAEERRLALSDTLEENKSLHQSIDSLKEENGQLQDLASQAAQLSSLLQSVVSDDEDEDKNTGSEETPHDNPDHDSDCKTPPTERDALQDDGRKTAVSEMGEKQEAKSGADDDGETEQRD